MLENRDDMRPSADGYRFRSSATAAVLVVNAIVFLLQILLLNSRFVDHYFALSLQGLRHGMIWQLLTFQFLHSIPWPWHLLLNCWMLFVFGRDVERSFGKTRFLLLYFSSGILGGLFQVLAALVWPQYFNSAVVGASAGVFGIVAAFAMLFPERPLMMLLFFVVPLKMRAKYLLFISLLLAAFGIANPRPQSKWILKVLGSNVAHAAHMGGILAGLAFVRWTPVRPAAYIVR